MTAQNCSVGTSKLEDSVSEFVAGWVAKGKKQNVGYVYLIESSCGAKVKIGSTTDPEKRKRAVVNISGGCRRTFYVGPVKPYKLIERAFHKALANTRIHGEWFSVDFDVLQRTLENVFQDYRTTEPVYSGERYRRHGVEIVNGILEFFSGKEKEPEAVATLGAVEGSLQSIKTVAKNHAAYSNLDSVAAHLDLGIHKTMQELDKQILAKEALKNEIEIAQIFNVPADRAQVEVVKRVLELTGVDLTAYFPSASDQGSAAGCANV